MSETTANAEGRLEIRIAPAAGLVDIRSSRPLLASRLFEGKSPEQTLQLLPLLFNVCGQAQQTAAVRAIESAQGLPADAATERLRDTLVNLETLREHLLRVALDWPRFCGAAPDAARLGPLLQTLEQVRTTLDPQRLACRQPGRVQQTDWNTVGPRWETLRRGIAEAVFGDDSDGWPGDGMVGLRRWLARCDHPTGQLLRMVCERGWQTLGGSAAPPLPPLPAAALAARLDSADAAAFLASPRWQAEAPETGPAARLAAHPLLVELRLQGHDGLLLRLVARLLEIAQLSAAPDRATTPRGAGATAPGLAQLEAARGRLCHRVLLDGDRIGRYRILAPTEWNFCRDGPAERALRDLGEAPQATLRAQAELLIHAIDPCVGYRLQIDPGA